MEKFNFGTTFNLIKYIKEEFRKQIKYNGGIYIDTNDKNELTITFYINYNKKAYITGFNITEKEFNIEYINNYIHNMVKKAVIVINDKMEKLNSKLEDIKNE